MDPMDPPLDPPLSSSQLLVVWKPCTSKEKTVVPNAMQITTRQPQYSIFQPQENRAQLGKNREQLGKIENRNFCRK